MDNAWIVTPQYFEQPETRLVDYAPVTAVLNGPHSIPDREAESMARLHGPIARFTEAALRRGQRPVSMAGDCCAAVPALAGMRAAGIEPWLVWIDAHGDFNTPETSPSQFLGGMPLAMMVGRGPQWMCESVGLAPFPEERVILVDARDLDPLEAEAVAGSGLTQIGVRDLATLALVGPVLVHIDLDVIDAREAPAFNYPVRGGPTASQMTAALEGFAAGTDIRMISISAWSPSKDLDGATGRACRRVLAALTGE